MSPRGWWSENQVSGIEERMRVRHVWRAYSVGAFLSGRGAYLAEVVVLFGAGFGDFFFGGNILKLEGRGAE